MKKRRKQQKKQIWILIPILLLFIIVGAAFVLMQKPVIVPADVMRFEAGTQITRKDLVKEVQNGILLNEDEILSLDQPGSRSVSVKVRNRLGIDSEETLVIEIYRVDPPTISVKSDSLKMLAGEEIDLLQDVAATDRNGNPLTVTVEGTYDPDQAGVYNLTYSATDEKGNTTKKAFTLTVLASPFDKNGKMVEGTYITATGHTLEIKNGIAYADGYLMANKSFSLPKSYNPKGLTEETNRVFHQIQAAARADGINIICKSGFRSWNDQNYIFNGYVREDGLEDALTYSARPGHSEHQSGMGMDLVTSSSSAVNEPEIAEALAWLNENAWKYGLILRYPEGKTDITGYIFEPWHYRYVGEELAEILYNNGDWITMEEYFGLDSVYRGY